MSYKHGYYTQAGEMWPGFLNKGKRGSACYSQHMSGLIYCAMISILILDIFRVSSAFRLN